MGSDQKSFKTKLYAAEKHSALSTNSEASYLDETNVMFVSIRNDFLCILK